MTMTRAELTDAARQTFDPAEPVRGADAAWDRIVAMGWLAMTVPEAQGGLGLDRTAAAIIHAEFGRALVPGPLAAQLAVIDALVAADGLAERDALLSAAISGTLMTASLMPGLGTVAVPDADRAERLLVLDGDRLQLAPLAGARVTPRPLWDESRRLFDVEITADGATLAQGDVARALAERLEGGIALAIAGDSLGGAEAILARTVDYLGVRQQFGRPLAMFQALKHRVADMRTRLSAADALFRERVADPLATPAAIGALKAHAATVYRDIAEDAVQLHGGIGLTMEHHCHLFLKRATLNAVLAGDADYWEERAGRAALAAAADA